MAVNWRFPPLSGGNEQGYTNSGIETFKDEELMDNLAREICQNSLDAKGKDSDAPVEVKFQLMNIEKSGCNVFSDYKSNNIRRLDMTINNLDNTFSVIKICHTDIENQISGYALEFPDIHNHNIEWHMRLPMFVPPFYDYVKTHNAIPNQYDYYKHYCQQNKNELISKDLTKEQVRGLRARVYRTYPSLVRDIHFGLFLISENTFEDVFYNEILDIEYGIDLVVKNNAENIGLCLFTKTKNAQYARKVKEFRPKKTVDFKCLEIPMDFKGSVSCGEFFLYGTREKNIIIETLNSAEK